MQISWRVEHKSPISPFLEQEVDTAMVRTEDGLYFRGKGVARQCKAEGIEKTFYETYGTSLLGHENTLIPPNQRADRNERYLSSAKNQNQQQVIPNRHVLPIPYMRRIYPNRLPQPLNRE